MSTGYNQPNVKRQKVREAKVENDYFQGIDKMEYNNMATLTDLNSYRYYNNSERVHSRPMEDWLKYSVSFTDFRSYGYEINGRQQHTRQWDDGSRSVENHKRCIKAFFDFCTKLGIKHWTAFDTDLVPLTDSWEENRVLWDDIAEYVQDLMQRYHLKLMWLAPDLHSHPRYVSGALTSNDATNFTQAATQIKKCLEISQRLNAECFLLWPFREGYEIIFQSDVTREIKLFAKLLKMTAEYKDKINYRCQLLIMPYYSCNFSNGWLWQLQNRRENDLVNKYMWDVTSCLYFLKNYNLDRFYKVCSLPGHHMYMANVYNMLGGVFITNDIDQYDSKTFTLMMKCIIDQGISPPGGINLKLRAYECSPRELLAAHAKYIDAGAKALRLSATLATEQTFTKHLQQRYSSYYSGFGSRLVSSDVTMEECEDYHKRNQSAQVESPKLEQLDAMFQRFLDTCDHI